RLAGRLPDLDLAPDLVLDGAMQGPKRVDVLELRLDSELVRTMLANGHVRLCPQLAFLHVGLRGPDIAEDRAQAHGKIARLIGASQVRLADSLHQRQPGPVEVGVGPGPGMPLIA